MLSFLRDSRFFGRPVELYRFTYGDGSGYVYRYTDAELPVVYNGETYSPLPIQRSATSNSGTLDKSSMEIVLPYNTEVPELFRVYPPGYVVGLTILQGEADDPANEFVAVWVGRILSCTWEGVEAKLNGEPISTSFRRSGLRRNYQYLCPHVLYGPQCRASKAAATVGVSVTAVSGRTVTLNGILTGYNRFTGGMLEWHRTDGRPEARTISAVAVSGLNLILTLTGLPSGLVAGASANAVRGCRHTLVACRDDHANTVNYGGTPWIPLKNPVGNVSPFQ